MAQILASALPPNLDLYDGYTIRLTAVSPTTGALVAGVKVSAVVLQVVNVSGSSIPDIPGFTVTPLLQFTGGVT